MDTPRQAIMFDFEANFTLPNYDRTLRSTSIGFGVVYLIIVFAGQMLMRPRPPFVLRSLLILWNVLLSIFSIFTVVRGIPELLKFYQEKRDFEHGICDNSYYTENKIISFWLNMFVWSKIIEFVDTVFLVLRKKPVILLHWYHHFITAIFSFFSIQERAAPLIWFSLTNAVIHSVMYPYYALRALDLKVPGNVGMAITSSQLLQMVFGCYISFTCHSALASGRYCGASQENVYFAMWLYFSFFVLFAHFFYKAYIAAKPAKDRVKKSR